MRYCAIFVVLVLVLSAISLGKVTVNLVQPDANIDATWAAHPDANARYSTDANFNLGPIYRTLEAWGAQWANVDAYQTDPNASGGVVCVLRDGNVGPFVITSSSVWRNRFGTQPVLIDADPTARHDGNVFNVTQGAHILVTSDPNILATGTNILSGFRTDYFPFIRLRGFRVTCIINEANKLGYAVSIRCGEGFGYPIDPNWIGSPLVDSMLIRLIHNGGSAGTYGQCYGLNISDVGNSGSGGDNWFKPILINNLIYLDPMVVAGAHCIEMSLGMGDNQPAYHYPVIANNTLVNLSTGNSSVAWKVNFKSAKNAGTTNTIYNACIKNNVLLCSIGWGNPACNYTRIVYDAVGGYAGAVAMPNADVLNPLGGFMDYNLSSDFSARYEPNNPGLPAAVGPNLLSPNNNIDANSLMMSYEQVIAATVIDANGGNLRLKAGSPARKTGTALSGITSWLTTDIVGKRRTKWDMGAFAAKTATGNKCMMGCD